MNGYRQISSHESWGPLGHLGIKLLITGFNRSEAFENYVCDRVGKLYEELISEHLKTKEKT